MVEMANTPPYSSRTSAIIVALRFPPRLCHDYQNGGRWIATDVSRQISLAIACRTASSMLGKRPQMDQLIAMHCKSVAVDGRWPHDKQDRLTRPDGPVCNLPFAIDRQTT
jgi:hypothetical protein